VLSMTHLLTIGFFGLIGLGSDTIRFYYENSGPLTRSQDLRPILYAVLGSETDAALIKCLSTAPSYPGISLPRLSLHFLFGFPLVGLPIVLVFHTLGKLRWGFLLAGIHAILFALTVANDWPSLTYLIPYAAMWVTAFAVAVSHRIQAKQALAKIHDRDVCVADALLVRGLCRFRILASYHSAVASIRDALQLDGGSAELWSVAARILTKMKQEEVTVALRRASSGDRTERID